MRNKNAHFSFHPRMSYPPQKCSWHWQWVLPAFSQSHGIVFLCNLLSIQGWHCPEQEAGPTLRKGTPWGLLQPKSLHKCVINTLCGWYQPGLQRGHRAEGNRTCSAGDFRGSVSSMLEKMCWPWQWQLSFTGQVCSGSQDAIPMGAQRCPGYFWQVLLNIITFKLVFSQAMAFQIFLLQNCY